MLAKKIFIAWVYGVACGFILFAVLAATALI